MSVSDIENMDIKEIDWLYERLISQKIEEEKKRIEHETGKRFEEI